MKPRKIRLTIDATTDEPLKKMRESEAIYLLQPRWTFNKNHDLYLDIDHIQVNAIRPAKAVKKGGM